MSVVDKMIQKRTRDRLMVASRLTERERAASRLMVALEEQKQARARLWEADERVRMMEVSLHRLRQLEAFRR